jgi:hypothetical protein
VAPDLQAASDSGLSSTDNITNDNTPTLDVVSTGPYYRLLRDAVQISTDYASGGTYIYAAFAENPFKNSLAR